MKKIKILSLATILLATCAAFATKANNSKSALFRIDPSDGVSCISETQCTSGSIDCGHAVYNTNNNGTCQDLVSSPKKPS